MEERRNIVLRGSDKWEKPLSNEILKDTVSQWGREIQKGCSRWQGLLRNRVLQQRHICGVAQWRNGCQTSQKSRQVNRRWQTRMQCTQMSEDSSVSVLCSVVGPWGLSLYSLHLSSHSSRELPCKLPDFTMFRQNAKHSRACTSAELFGIINEIQRTIAIMAIARSTGIDHSCKSIFKLYLKMNVRRKNSIGKIKAMRPQCFWSAQATWFGKLYSQEKQDQETVVKRGKWEWSFIF